MIIYLARHGQTTGDIESRYGGDYDDNLTESGRNQAEELAKKFSKFGIQQLYTSPKIRAKETAEIVSTHTQLKPQIVDDFRECNRYGVLTGLTKREAEKRFPKLAIKAQDPMNTVDGGERYPVFKKRILYALNSVVKPNKSVICIITHGGPIRLIFREVLNMGEIEIGDCAFVKLEFSNDRYRIIESSGIIHRSQ